MSDDRGTFRNGIQRFRAGGISIGALPLVLGIALLLAGERVSALQMIVISVILILLVLWITHCLEDVMEKFYAERQSRN